MNYFVAECFEVKSLISSFQFSIALHCLNSTMLKWFFFFFFFFFLSPFHLLYGLEAGRVFARWFGEHTVCIHHGSGWGTLWACPHWQAHDEVDGLCSVSNQFNTASPALLFVSTPPWLPLTRFAFLCVLSIVIYYMEWRSKVPVFIQGEISGFQSHFLW